MKHITNNGVTLCMLVCLACLILSARAAGELSWEATEHLLAPDVVHRKATASFSFTNTGPKSVRITELKTSCKCAAALLGKKEYAPGESGTLEMTIDRKGRSTNQVESTRVTTSDGKTTVLVMKIQTARFLDVKPGFVVWKRGDDHKTRTFDVEVTNEDVAVGELKVTATNANFSTRVTTVEPGKRYRVQVTAESTDKAVVATFTIQANGPKGQPDKLFAYGKVL